MQSNTYHTPPTDAIDLRRMFKVLWASKLWILVTTAAVTCIAGGYAFLAAPTYEVTVSTMPPTTSGLAGYNAGSQLTGAAIGGILQSNTSGGIKELTPAEAYAAFLLRLTSDSVRQEFFQQLYLPAHREEADNTREQGLWKELNKQLSIKVPTKADEHVAKLSLRGGDAETIALWANEYVDIAIDSTRKDLLADLAGDVKVRKKAVVDQINTLRDVALVGRKDRITRLTNALEVAQAVGLEVPPVGSPLITVGGTFNNMDVFTNGSMMYLQGTKALRSELNQLKLRVNDDAYLPELTDLLKKQALLDSIDLNPEHLSVAVIDRAAIVPDEPVKPQKLLILIIGFLLGGMLGILLVFVRHTSKAATTLR